MTDLKQKATPQTPSSGKRKVGRPRKADKKTHRVAVRFTEEENIRFLTNTNIYRKKGGMKSAEKDFDEMNLSDIVEFETKYGTGKRGVNEKGERIILRPGSSDGAPTIERQVNGKKKTEIRYDD